MSQPACLEEEEQKTFRIIQPSKWPDLVLAGALVETLPVKMGSLELLPLRAVALPHQPPLCHVLLFPTLPLQWPQLVLARVLVGAFFPSVENELDQAASI